MEYKTIQQYKNWERAGHVLSRSIRHLHFTDITKRIDCYRGFYANGSDVPHIDPHFLTQGGIVETHILQGRFDTLISIYQADGLRKNFWRDRIYAMYQNVPNQSPMRRHEYVEILCVLSGEFSQILLGETHTFTEGDFVICDQNCEHADLWDEKDCSVLFLRISPAYIDELLASQTMQQELQRFLFHAISKKKREQSFLVFHPKSDTTRTSHIDIPFLLEHLVSEEYSQLPAGDTIITGHLVRLLFTLGEEYTLERYTDQRTNQEELVLFQLEKYIREHPDTVNAHMLEEEFHYHRNYFNLLLQKHRGQSLKEYIQSIRIKKACMLLTHTDLSVKQIAKDVGYENISFFYQLFARHMGQKPAAYRITSRKTSS